MKRKLSSFIFKSRNIYFILVSVSILILLFSALYFPYYTKSLSDNWESYHLKEANKITENIQERFLDEQKSISKKCERVRKKLHKSFENIELSQKTSLLFEILKSDKKRNLNFQILSDSLKPLAWTDTKVFTEIHIPPPDVNQSFEISRDNFRKFLIFTCRIDLGNTTYYLSAIKTLETNYFLQNEFIKNESFISDIQESSRFKFRIVWDTSSSQKTIRQTKLGKETSRYIRFHDGKIAFYLTIHVPDRDFYIEQLNKELSKFQKLILLFAFVVLIISLVRDLRTIDSFIIKVFILSISIWLIRLVLMIIDFTSFFEGSEIVNPSFYASRFGYGLVKSPLDLFLTSTALVLNFLIILFHLKIWFLEKKDYLRNFSKVKKIFLSVIAGLLIILVPFSFRATGAIFRSFVFDSSIKYFEQKNLLPDLTTSLMYYNVFVNGILIVAFLQLVVWISFISANFWTKIDFKKFFLIFFTALSSFLIIFNLLDKNPQFNSIVAILFTFVTLLASFLILEEKYILSFRSIILILIISSIFSSILLFNKTDLQERELQKTIVNELIKPRDELIRFALNQILQNLSTDDELIEKIVLSSWNNSFDFNFITYKYWVNSILSDEGLNSYLLLFNNTGNLIGAFGFGMKEPDYIKEYFDYKMVTNPAFFVIKHRDLKSILGITPLRYQEKIFGFAGVLIEVDKPENISENKTSLFQNIKYEKNALKLIPELAIYKLQNQEWALVSGENLPVFRELSYEINEKIRNGMNEFWIKEKIDGRNYQSYIYVFNSSDQVKAISISIPIKRWTYYVFNVFKLILVHILISVFVIILTAILLLARGYKFKLKFKTKLFAGLFIITFLPIIFLAYFTRDSELKRWTESLSNEIKKDLDFLSITLSSNSLEISQSTKKIEELTQNLKIDFNLYIDYRLLYSTQDKLYKIEFFPQHLPSKVYNDLNLKNKNYSFDFEYISNYPYLVGYKRINTQNSSYIISIPTIYKQEKIQRDLAQIDTFILGSYSLTIILIFIFGNIFFERVTKPISQLTEATKKISEGDLSIKLDRKEEDEVGDLIDAFNKMIRDLEESRKKLARAEREYAWKEMAKQVAHEIKNPLTPMKLSLQHLQVLYKENKKEFARIFGKVSTTLVEQIETLVKITNEFSHFAKMPERNITKCDLEMILGEIVNLYSTQTKISLESVKNENYFVYADKEELTRVFINLIKNSIQANTKEVKLKLYSDANYCFINVEDDGCGIPDEYKDRLFEPTFSTKTEGTGIGLAIVKKIIEDLNGTIEIKSEVNKGTIAMIALPKAEDNNSDRINRKPEKGY